MRNFAPTQQKRSGYFAVTGYGNIPATPPSRESYWPNMNDVIITYTGIISILK